ncbi:MAG: recombinase RecA, partial [Pseudomonadota bacterium]|nr:recombinase RecA [Pseudomonadota bacterium]
IVEKSGAWFSYDGQRIGQGRQNAKIFLKENTEVAEEIEQKIRENAGLISEQMLEGAQNEESDEEAPMEITMAEGKSD